MMLPEREATMKSSHTSQSAPAPSAQPPGAHAPPSPSAAASLPLRASLLGASPVLRECNSKKYKSKIRKGFAHNLWTRSTAKGTS